MHMRARFRMRVECVIVVGIFLSQLLQVSSRTASNVIAIGLGGEMNKWESRTHQCGALYLASQLQDKHSSWRLRVYHDIWQQTASGPGILEALEALGAELIFVPHGAAANRCVDRRSGSANHTQHFWPFRALSDPMVYRTSSLTESDVAMAGPVCDHHGAQKAIRAA